METCFANARPMARFGSRTAALKNVSPFADLPDELPKGTTMRLDADGFAVGYVHVGNGVRTLAADTGSASYASFALPLPPLEQPLPARAALPPFSLQHCGLLANALGEWQNVAGNTSGAAPADGFLLVRARATARADRGWANVRVAGKIRGSCAIQGDCSEQTFWVPLTRGEQWRLASAATAGAPEFTAHWVALRTLRLSPLRQLHPNMAYQAHTDGFLVTVLEAGDGGHAVASLQAGGARALLDINPAHTTAAVRLDTRAGTILPSATATMAVQRGQFYRAALRTTGNPVAFSVYWISLTA